MEGRIMTRRRSIELECPRCSAKQKVSVYDSINVSVDPDLKEKLFKGEINVCQCEKCDQAIFVPNPLLYHDMEKELMVQFYPFQAIGDKDFLQQFSKEGGYSNEMVKRLPKGLRDAMRRIHFVFDMAELIRFVLFREKLYELWMEAN
jgi:hypothetical protein